jgi:hypothetical protein
MAAQDAFVDTAAANTTPWEVETRKIVEELRRDRLKAEQRRLAAERQVAEFDTQIAVLERTIDQQRAKLGLGKAPLVVSPQAAQPYKSISPKEMLFKWADDHGGELVMNDAAQFLAAAGLFTDPQQAAGTLYPTIRRMEDEFEKVTRGVYRRTERRLREVALTTPRDVAAATDNRDDNVIDLDDTPF